jgi:hypothetical protein
MTSQDPNHPVQLAFSRAELERLRVALRLLLASEDDPQTIAEVKLLLARLAAVAERDPA